MAADGRRPPLAGWAAAEADGDDAASAVLSGDYQALEMSAMVSALAHVVAAGGGDDGSYPPAAMAPAGGYAHEAAQQQWGSYPPPAAAAPTRPDHFFASGEIL